VAEDQNCLSVDEEACKQTMEHEQVVKSRTLSDTTKRKSITSTVQYEPRLTPEHRSASVDLLHEKKSDTLPIHEDKTRERSKSDLRISVSKKKLKSLFRLSKHPDSMPKIEVSGPISADILGTACFDDVSEPMSSNAAKSKKNLTNENVYDEVPGKPVVSLWPLIKCRLRSIWQLSDISRCSCLGLHV